MEKETSRIIAKTEHAVIEEKACNGNKFYTLWINDSFSKFYNKTDAFRAARQEVKALRSDIREIFSAVLLKKARFYFPYVFVGPDCIRVLTTKWDYEISSYFYTAEELSDFIKEYEHNIIDFFEPETIAELKRSKILY